MNSLGPGGEIANQRPGGQLARLRLVTQYKAGACDGGPRVASLRGTLLAEAVHCTGVAERRCRAELLGKGFLLLHSLLFLIVLIYEFSQSVQDEVVVAIGPRHLSVQLHLCLEVWHQVHQPCDDVQDFCLRHVLRRLQAQVALDRL